MANKADKIVSCKTCGEKFPFGQINQHRKKHPKKAKEEPTTEEPETDQPVSEPTGLSEPAFVVAPTERVVEDMPNLERTETAPTPNPPSSHGDYTPRPPPAAPLPTLPPIATAPFVGVLCDLFDRSVAEATTPGVGGGPPPAPGPITADDRKAIAESIEPLLLKWLPRMGPYALEINAVLVTAAVFGPRLLAAKARRNWYEENARKAPPTPPTAARPSVSPSVREDELLRIGDRWAAKVATA